MSSPPTHAADGSSVKAVYTHLIPAIDGSLEESHWITTPMYQLEGVKNENTPEQKTWIQLAWNNQGLYVSARCEDSSIIQNNRKDEQLHYRYGDCLEIFLKSADQSYYWETYVTPYGNKTTIFHLKPYLGPWIDDYLTQHNFRELEVSTKMAVEFKVDGRVVKGWTAEMWIPRSYMTHYGDKWETGASWTLLGARYNYSMNTSLEPEYSMFPEMEKLSFHLTDKYARLELLPPKE